MRRGSLPTNGGDGSGFLHVLLIVAAVFVVAFCYELATLIASIF